MGIFKSRKKAETSNPLDAETLAAIGSRSNLGMPRDWVHYVYCSDEAGAQAIAIAAAGHGWQLQRVDAAASGDGWIVVAEQNDVIVTTERVKEARSFFEHLAASVQGGDYDGWEASI